jgi:hypothetical protein
LAQLAPNSLHVVPSDPKQKAGAEVRKAQAEFERADAQRGKASAARRERFERAQATGLSMRDIARETGLHFTRVAEILRGE